MVKLSNNIMQFFFFFDLRSDLLNQQLRITFQWTLLQEGEKGRSKFKYNKVRINTNYAQSFHRIQE